MRNFMKWFLPMVILGGVMVPAFFAGAQTPPPVLGPGDHIPVCHTGNGVHFVFITPSATSGGPAGHEMHEFDIFATYQFQQNPGAPITTVQGQGDASLIDVENESCLAIGPTPTPTPTDTPTEPPPTGEPPTGAPPAAPPEDAAEITTELAETL